MPAFTHYKTITIASTSGQCGSANSTDFPFTLVVTHADLKTVANGGKVQSSSGFDIRPYDSTRTTALDFQLVAYDGSTGAVELYIRIPTLKGSGAGSDTVIALQFGDPSLTTDGTSTATWRSEYKAVLHLKDNAASTTVVESTSNANTGTNAANTSGKSVTGQLGKALTYNGSTDVTTLPNIAALHSVNQISFSCWVKFTALTDFVSIMVESQSTAEARFGLLLSGTGVTANTGALLVFGEGPGGNSSYAYTVSGLFSTGVWYHLVGTYDTSQSTNATRAHVYVNGADKALTFQGGFSPTTPIAPGTDPIRLATDNRGSFCNCVIDEARAYAGVLSPSWITAEYNNQRTQTGTGDFYTLGTTTAIDLSASLTATLGALTCSATATVAVSASLTATLGTLTASSSASVAVSASLTATLGALTCLSTATVATSASLTATLGVLTLSSTAVVGTPPISASLTATLGTLTAAASATVRVSASLTATLGPLTLAAQAQARSSASLVATLGTLTLAAQALVSSFIECDTTSLAQLQTLMAQRWDGVVFWTAEEARLALNEALREWNLLTGRWRTRVQLTALANNPEVALPGVMTYGMRVTVGGFLGFSTVVAARALTPSSLAELELGRPSWRLETTASGGGVPTTPIIWAPIGLRRIAIWPAFSLADGTQPLLADGVLQTPSLVNPSDLVDLGEEIIDYIVDMALHIAAFKEGGARWRATRPLFEAFLQAAAEENGLLKTNQRYRRFAGLDRRRDLMPTTGATNQIQGVATQFSRHDQSQQQAGG